MKQTVARNQVSKAWLLFGGLFALSVTYLFVRELPSVRREIHLMRM
jgi:hypothetical protein